MVAPILAAALPAGLNLLGGLLGNKKQPEPETKFEYGKMRAAAEAAGFNPLTVLKATGGAPTSVSNPVPALSSAAVIANALGTGAQAFFDAQPDPLQQERDRLEIDLMRKQMDSVVRNDVYDERTGQVIRTSASRGWSGAPVTTQTQEPARMLPPRGVPGYNLEMPGQYDVSGVNDPILHSGNTTQSGFRVDKDDILEIETFAMNEAATGTLFSTADDLIHYNTTRGTPAEKQKALNDHRQKKAAWYSNRNKKRSGKAKDAYKKARQRVRDRENPIDYYRADRLGDLDRQIRGNSSGFY